MLADPNKMQKDSALLEYLAKALVIMMIDTRVRRWIMIGIIRIFPWSKISEALYTINYWRIHHLGIPINKI